MWQWIKTWFGAKPPKPKKDIALQVFGLAMMMFFEELEHRSSDRVNWTKEGF